MKCRLYLVPFIFTTILLMANCAKKGTPSGGKKDSIPPVIIKSDPENFSINFDQNEIRIYFDEYIKLKDLQKNLIISPPLDYTPIISPLSTSKMIKIKILDTLRENTTYSINFGKSIVDNNEENPFNYYKYVFSTGNYIDSLTVAGTIKDALLLSPANNIAVMLYEVNENFKDSLIFTKKPTYIAAKQDSTSSFRLTNLKEGRYLLLALNEKTSDYIYQPSSDKIGFHTEYIELPTDSSFDLSVFKEIPPYKFSRPSHESKHEILFGYIGKADSLMIDLLSTNPSDFVATSYKDLKKDTIHYWFKPALDQDSLVFRLKNRSQIDTLTVKMKNLYADSLKINSLSVTTLKPNDTLKLSANTPLQNFDAERVKVLDKDSLEIPVSTTIDTNYNTASIIFERTEEQNYSVQILPDAFMDLYGTTNDTLSYNVRTKATSDYGTLSLNINNVKDYPIIVQLVDSKFNVVNEKVCDKPELVYFDYIDPGSYYLRIIYDSNKNNIWDTGDFLKRRNPEIVIYYPTKLEVLANWSLNETFTLD